MDRRRRHVKRNVDIGVSVGPVWRRNIGQRWQVIAGRRKLVAGEKLRKQLDTFAQNLQHRQTYSDKVILSWNTLHFSSQLDPVLVPA